MRFQLKVVTSTQTQLLPIDSNISAIAGASYTLVDSEGQPVVEALVIKRKGKALEIEVEEQLVASIEDFYSTEGVSYVVDDTNPSPENVIESMKGNVVEEGVVWQADGGFLGLDTSTLLMAGGGILGLGAIAAASGGSDDETPTIDGTTPPPVDVTTPPPVEENSITVVPVAGIFQSAVQIDIFDKDGNAIGGDVTLLDNGEFSVVVTSDYQGLILVQVTDINGGDVDYIDETTGELVSLGSEPLRAIGMIDENGNATVTVSPLTELAVRLAEIDDANISLSADDMAMNQAVGELFSVEEIAGTIVTLLDSSYDSSDGISDAEAYGNILAMLSGVDSVTGNIANTLAQLEASIHIDEQGVLSIDSAGIALLESGVAAFESGANGDKADLSEIVANIAYFDDIAPIARVSIDFDAVQLETFGDSSDAQVAGIGSVGEYAVAWVGINEVNAHSIYVQQFAADGSVGNYSQVQLDIEGVSGFEQAPQISAIGNDGDYVVTFSGIDSDGDSSIFVQQFAADGTVSLDMVQLEAIGVDSAHDFTPQVSGVGSNNEYVVTWRGKDTEGDYSIFVQQFNSDGTVGDFAPVQLEAIGVTSGYDSEPQVEATGDAGEYIVTWIGIDSDGEKSTFEQQFTANGTVGEYTPVQLGKVEEAVIDADDGMPHSTVISEDGSYVNTWQSVNDAGVSSVNVQKFSGDSAQLSIVINGSVNVQSNELGTAYLVNTNVVVTDEASITSAADNNWNSVAITAIDSATLMAATGLVEGSYQVYVIDALGNLSAPATSPIKIDDSAPVFTSVDNATIDENSELGQVVYTATSTDASAVTYQLADDIDSNAFTINANTGEVFLINSADAEVDTDYSFTVIATDATGYSSEKTVNVTINDIDESTPTITSGITADAIDENSGAGQVVYTASATDTADVDDATDTSSALTYQLKDGLDAGDFTINETTGEVTLTGNPDFENKDNHSFTILATDAAGNSTEQLVNLAINNIDDDAPLATVNHNIPAVQLEAIGDTVRSDYDPQITAIGSSGEYVVTWYGRDSDYDYSVFVQQFNSDGTTDLYQPVQLEAIGNSSDTDSQPQITSIGSNGEYVVTWRGRDSEGDYSIFVQQFNSDGTTGDYQPVKLEAIGVTDEVDTEPQITSIGNDGEYVVTWSGEDSNSDSSIFVQQFNSDGTTGDYQPVQLEATGVNDDVDYSPQVTSIGSDGEYVLTWYGDDRNNDYAIFVQQFNSDGTTGDYQPVQLEIADNRDGDNAEPQITALGTSGEYVVTWVGQEGEDSGNDNSIFVQQFNSDGTVGDYQPVQLEAIGVNYYNDEQPQITAIGSEGEYVVTWSGEDSGDDSSIFVQQFNSDGTVGDYQPVQLEAIGNTNGYDYGPQITAIGSVGEYVVTWRGTDSDGDYSIFVQQFNSDGTVGDYAPVQLEAIGNTSDNDYDPQITAIGSDGAYVVTWRGYDSGNSIFVQQFNSDGTLAGPLSVTSDDEVSVQSTEVGMAYLVSSDVIVTDVASITSAADNNWNSVVISEVDTATMLSTVGLVEGEYRVYTADALGNLSQPALNIVTIDDTAPILTSEDTTIVLEDNSGAGQVVYTVTATDDNDKVTYQLAETVDSDAFSINEITGDVSLIGNPDADTQTDYSFTVLATDSAGNVSEVTNTVTVTITDVDDSAPIFTSNNPLSVDEHTGAGQVIYTAVATDTADVDDATDTSSGITYQLKDTEDVSYLTIDSSTGEVTLVDDPDFEVKEYYSFTVVATDAAGNASEHSVELDINNIDDDAPIATVNNSYARVQLEAIGRTTSNDEQPQITSIGAGEYVVTWYGYDSEGDRSIFVQQFTRDGTVGDYQPVQLEAIGRTYSTDQSPQITSIGSDGGYVVTWSGYDNTSDYSIFVQQFNSDGTTGDYQPVQLAGVDDDYTPQVTAIGSNGEYAITWRGDDNDYDYSIFVQQFTNDGTIGDYQPVQLEAINNTRDNNYEPQITPIGNDGEYVVTWYGEDDNGDYSVFVQQFNSDGTMGTHQPVQLEAIGVDNKDDNAPQVTGIGNDGEYAVTWTGEDSEGDESIFVQQFESDGTVGDYAPVQLEAISNTSSNDYRPQISAVGSDGEYVVIWTGEDSEGDRSIFVQQFTRDGTTGDYQPVQLEAIDRTYSTDQTPQVTAIGDDGGYVVTWSGYDSTSDYSIFVQQFNGDGTTDDYQPIQLKGANDAYAPQITSIGSNGEYAVTWYGHDDEGDYSIFVQQFAADGTLFAPLTVTSSGDVSVQSSEIGTAYLVNTDVVVTDVASITGAAATSWNSVDILVVDTETLLPTTGLAEGHYQLYIVDAVGNVSTPASSLVTVDDTAPVISSADTATSINENTGAGQVVYTIAATDENEQVSYQLSEDLDGAAFSLNNATGAVSLMANPDAETQNSYSFTVLATDTAGNTSEKTISLTINDIDDSAPVITSINEAVAIDEHSGAGQVVYTVMATDTADIDDATDTSGALTYQLKDDSDSSAFSFNDVTGEVTLIDDPDFEEQENYSFTVVATDVAGNATEQLVTLAINNIDDDAPIATVNNDYAAIQLAGVDDDYRPQITAIGSEGDYVVTWYGDDSDGDYSIFVQKFNSDGNTGGYLPVQLEAIGVDNDDDYHPQISAIGSTGEFVVTWEGEDSNNDSSIFVQQFNADGTIGDYQPVQLEGTGVTNKDDYDAQLTEVGEAGEYVVTWRGEDSAGDESIFVQQFNSDGTIGDYQPVQLEATGRNNSGDYDPQITSLGSDGGYVVTWSGEDSNWDSSIFVQQFNSDGTTGDYQAVQLEAIGNTNNYDFSPQITAVGSVGEYVVTWYGDDSDNDRSIFVQQFNSDGTVGDYQPVQLEAIGNTTGSDYNPQITAIGSTGEYVVTWNGEDDNNSNNSIFVQQFNSNGTVGDYQPVLLEAIGTTNNYNLYPQITSIGRDGDYVVTWYGTDSDGDYSVFVQQFNSDGTVGDYTPVQLEAIGRTNSSDRHPQITAIGSDGEYVVTWYGADSDYNNSIFVQKFNSDGTLAAPLSVNSAGSVSVQSNEVGMAYIVSTDVVVTDVASITSAADSQWNAIAITEVDTETLLSTTGLAEGDYLVYTVDELMQVSMPAHNVITIDDTVPVITSDVIAVELNDNSGAGQVVYTAIATDDSGKVIYQLVDELDSDAFSVNESTGEVSFIANPDAETQTDYSFTVIATDAAGNSSEETRTISVTINDLDDSTPIFTSIEVADAIDENSGAGQVIYTATATDTADVDDATDTSAELTYHLTDALDASYFSIDENSGEVTLIANPDFEDKADYSFTIVATDAAGNATEQLVTLDITNVSADNDKPVATLNNTYAPVQLEAIGSDNRTDDQSQITAIGDSGEYVVTWRGYDSSGDYSIFVQQFNSDGTAGDYAPVQLEAIDQTNNSDQTPQVSSIGNSGEYVVTWSGYDSSNDYSVFVQQFNSDGTVGVHLPVQLEAIDNATYTDQTPQVSSIGSDGAYVVTWSGYDSGIDYSIFVQQFNSDGTVGDNAPVQLEAIGRTNNTDQQAQVTAIGSEGEYVVTWSGVDSSGDYSIFVQQFNSDGTIGDHVPVQLEPISRTTRTDDQPQVTAIGSDGGYVVIWEGDNSSYRDRIFVQQFNSDGTVGDYQQVELGGVEYQYSSDYKPQITAIGSNGEYAVTWYGRDSNGDNSIFVQQFSSDGTVGDYQPVKLEPLGVTNGYDYNPQITSVGSNGEYVVTWSGRDSEGDESIFVQQFNSDGTTGEYLPQQLEAIGVTDDDDYNPQVTSVGSNGEYVVTWTARDNDGDSSIFVQQFTAAGLLTYPSNFNASDNLYVQSNELGMAYLVNTDIAVTDEASITNAAGSNWNSVAITTANSDTAMAAAGLVAGNYHVYTVDGDGNISAPSSEIITIDNTAPVLESITPSGDNEATRSDNIVLTFSEDIQLGLTGDIRLIDASDANNQVVIHAQENNQLLVEGNTLTINPLAGLSPDRNYLVEIDQGVIEDLAGNSYQNSGEDLTVNFGGDFDSSTVVFDLVEGVSSDHSEREFSADVAYNIVVRFDYNNIDGLSTDGGSDGNTWGIWDGAENLDFGDDDTIVFVGNVELDNPDYSSLWYYSESLGHYFGYSSSSSYGVTLTMEASGNLRLEQWNSSLSSYSDGDFSLWEGFAGIPSSNTDVINVTYRTAITAGVLTSQGLVGIV